MADEAEERHASWLELFFDLTVVAAAAQISHRLHGVESIGQVAACAAMYYAIWSVWTTTSVYANVAGERTRRRAVLRTMLGVGVMAAAIPGVFPELLPEHGEPALQGRTAAFTVAFLLCRGIAAQAASRDGQVIAFWPATQGVMAAPWFVSLFVPPTVAYWLWGLAIVLDITLSILGARNPRALEERAPGSSTGRSRSSAGTSGSGAWSVSAVAHPTSRRPRRSSRWRGSSAVISTSDWACSSSSCWARRSPRSSPRTPSSPGPPRSSPRPWPRSSSS